jgi:hypothetical protein
MSFWWCGFHAGLATLTSLLLILVPYVTMGQHFFFHWDRSFFCVPVYFYAVFRIRKILVQIWIRGTSLPLFVKLHYKRNLPLLPQFVLKIRKKYRYGIDCSMLLWDNLHKATNQDSELESVPDVYQKNWWSRIPNTPEVFNCSCGNTVPVLVIPKLLSDFSRFGGLLVQFHPNLLDSLQPQLNSPRLAVRKRAIICLGYLVMSCDQILYIKVQFSPTRELLSAVTTGMWSCHAIRFSTSRYRTVLTQR